jgi:hypothetical protein
MSYSSLLGTRPEWLREGKFRILLQISTAKHPALGTVPIVIDLAANERQRQIMKLLFARQLWGRPFVAPPQVPEPRLAALRKAFSDTLNDPAFREEAQRAKLEITPVDGETIQREVADVFMTLPDVVAAAKNATKPK